MGRGELKCPGGCNSIVGSFLLEPFTYGNSSDVMSSCSCGKKLRAKVVFVGMPFGKTCLIEVVDGDPTICTVLVSINLRLISNGKTKEIAEESC